MSTSKNQDLIERFYAAFSHRDGAAMADCYHAQARFRDPVFTLEGAHIGMMWKMLCARGADLRVEYTVNPGGTSADWQAWYTFSTTKRSVHNIVRARFAFRDGRILEHIDTFDFWRWSRQALGPVGVLLGWSPPLQRKVRAQAADTLAKYAAGAAAASR